jgi:RNA polymerase sigma factor (sigma-70 family)
MDPAFTESSLERATDERLVTLSRGGLDVAVEAIVRRYRTALVYYASRFLDPDQAEHVVQEAFVKGLMALETDDKRIHLRSWLYRIVHSEAINASRLRGSDEAHDDGEGEAKSAEYLARVERLRSIVVGANRPEPAVARAVAVDRSPEEIAKDLAETRANVGELIQRARAGLRSAGDALVPRQQLRSWFANLSSPGMRGLVTAGAAAVVVATVVGAATLGTHGGSLDSGSGKSSSASSSSDSKPKVAGPRRNGGTRAPRVESQKPRHKEAQQQVQEQAPVVPFQQVSPPASSGNVAGGSAPSQPKHNSKTKKKSKPKEGTTGEGVIVLGEKNGTTGTTGTTTPGSQPTP